MTFFEMHNAGNTEAQQKAGLAFLLAQSSVGKAATGVLTGLAVSQTTTASGSVVVAAGAAVAQASTLDGASELVNDSAYTLNVLGANPMGGLPRNDIVVFDAATTSVRVIVGTPSATPSDPTVPSSAAPLARIRNAASATTIATAAIDDLRTFTSLYGVESAGAWTHLTVTGTGWFETTANSLSLQARTLPSGMVELVGALTSSGTSAFGALFQLPVGMRPSVQRFLPAHRTSGGTSGTSYQLYVDTNGYVRLESAYISSIPPGVAFPVSGVFPL